MTRREIGLVGAVVAVCAVVAGMVVWDWVAREPQPPPERHPPAVPLTVRVCDPQVVDLSDARWWWEDRCHQNGLIVRGGCTGPIPDGEFWLRLAPPERLGTYDWGDLVVREGRLVRGYLEVRSWRDPVGERHVVGHILGYLDYPRPGHVMGADTVGEDDYGLDLCVE